MTWLEFVSSLINHLLSWPTLFVTVAFIFRNPVAKLINRLRAYEGFGGKFTFGDQLARAEASVNDAVEGIQEISSHNERSTAARPSPLIQEAEKNPSYAIIRAWEMTNSALRDLAGTTLTTGELVPRLGNAATGISTVLVKKGIVGRDFSSSVDALRLLRNEVAHGRHNPTPGEAVTFVESAEEIANAAQLLGRRYSSPKPSA